ncbi:MAG: DUF1810 family protein [Bacteroidetes bacterium]|nr:MAG: DUF1810 family protein [Bacteroidota bacterium]
MDDIIIIISHANIVYTFDKNEQNFIYIEELRNESKYLDTLKRRHWNKNIINKKYLILPKNKFSNDNVKSVLFFLQTLLNLKKQEFKEFSINFRLIFENLENYNDNLERFIKAQAYNYLEAFSEINNGRKISHWMWYVFPAISGRYGSEMSKKYAIQNLGEAEAYLKHEILGKRLIELCEILIQTEGKTANQIFGDPDDIKLKACMTLFGMLENTNPIFGTVLEKYFEGTKDNKTEQILQS